MKITPAHDFNDFEVGGAAGWPRLTCSTNTPPLIYPMKLSTRWTAKTRGTGLTAMRRKKIVATLEGLGLVDKIEPDTHMVPYGDRSNQVIEPWLTDQWYVDAETMAKPAVKR